MENVKYSTPAQVVSSLWTEEKWYGNSGKSSAEKFAILAVFLPKRWNELRKSVIFHWNIAFCLYRMTANIALRPNFVVKPCRKRSAAAHRDPCPRNLFLNIAVRWKLTTKRWTRNRKDWWKRWRWRRRWQSDATSSLSSTRRRRWQSDATSSLSSTR